jgi:hypothetical protein
LIAEPLLQLGQVRIVLVLQEIGLQPHDRLAVAVQREPRVVHPVLIQVRQNLAWMERSRCREPGHYRRRVAGVLARRLLTRLFES